jgi:hypothetical protein
MSLSAPRSFFGVHSWTPYSRTNGLFYGTLKVLKGSSLSLSSEMTELNGGTSKYPWAIEEGLITAEMSLKFSQYEDFLFELFLGKAPSPVSAETSGNCSSLTNKYGTSLMHATTGIATVTVKAAEKTDLKFGKYVVKVVSATTVDVYYSSDLDIGRGTNGVYANDALKVTASPLTITASTATEITDFGLELTGGSGTIGMTTGDTATFMVRPISTGGMTVDIGGQADQSFPEFGSIVMAAKRGNGEMLELDCYKCKAAGMPLNFEQNAFSEAEVKIKCLYDQDLDKVFSLRHVKAT